MSDSILQVRDGDGEPLDARFELDRSADNWAVVFRARYGGRESPRATNTDYFAGLELLLSRMARIAATIEAVTVDSRPARQLPRKDRLLPLSYPIAINSETDVRELRLAMTRLQRGIARSPNAKSGGGNNHKRIRIEFVPNGPVDAAAMTEQLVGGPIIGTQAPELGFGVDYRPADEELDVSAADPWSHDPSKQERSWRSHSRLQNALEAYVRSGYALTRSARLPAEPDFDLGWDLGDRLFVCEVKSTLNTNQEKQLRLGLGQVLRYQHQLEALYPEVGVSAVLAIEAPPVDQAWIDLARSLGVTLTWPPQWPGVSLD